MQNSSPAAAQAAGEREIITVYTVATMEDAYVVLSLLKRMADEHLVTFGGFLGLKLYLSDSGMRVVGHERWCSTATAAAVWGSSEAESIVKKIQTACLGIDPCVYSFEAQYPE